MIIKGIDEGFEQIDLYGVHLECDQEWAFERPCVEFWMGFAAGKGIKIDVATAADVCRGSHIYGYAEVETQRKKILSRIEGFVSRLNDMQRQRTIMVNQMAGMEGELNMTAEQRSEMIASQDKLIQSEKNVIAQKGVNGYNDIVVGKIQDQLKKMNMEIYELDKRINSVNGAKEDSEYFLKQLNA
jgi:septal ring factor EnvC (AmiA/AmiB activator)